MRDARELDLNLLVIFHAVYQRRQISDVARQLNLSQPTVSNALARLRRELGDELFVRTGQGMQPTPRAQEIAEPIASALRSVNQVLNWSEAFDPGLSERHFVIAMTDAGESHFMPLIIARCAAAGVGIRISAVRASTVALRTDMETGKVDLAIGAFTDLPQGLYHRRLFAQRFVLLFRRGHPLGGQAITRAGLLSAQHLIVTTSESPYPDINQKLEKAGVMRHSQFSVTDFSAVPYIVSTTDLVATVPEKLALRAAASFQLDHAPLPIRLPSLLTSLFWHRRFGLDAGNRWLREFIGDACVE